MRQTIYTVIVMSTSPPFEFQVLDGESIVSIRPLNDRIEVWISGSEESLRERQEWILREPVTA